MSHPTLSKHREGMGPRLRKRWVHVYCTMSMKPVADVVEPLTALTVTL